MELNNLKKVWKQQEPVEDREYTESDLMMLINNKMISLEEEVKSRDRLEILVAIVVIGVFCLWGMNAARIWTQAGCAVIVISAAFIWYKIKNTQRLSFDTDHQNDRSMREHLIDERQALRQQKNMLQSVAWWYLSPIWVGLLLITIGFSSGLVFKVGYMIAVTTLYAWIWKKNQEAVKHRFEPLENEINEAIASIDEAE